MAPNLPAVLPNLFKLKAAAAATRGRMGLLTRVSLGVLLAGVLIAAAVGWYLERHVADLLLDQVVARANDQVQLGILPRVAATDFDPPFLPAELGDLASRLDPLLERARQE